jgi:O-acetyl-ADP-ribose deacetylase (regulator of RNase III)
MEMYRKRLCCWHWRLEKRRIMNQSERRSYLIRELLKENPDYQSVRIPQTAEEQKQLLRALMNVRLAGDQSEEFLKIQDEYLQEAAREKGIVQLSELKPLQEGLYLWRGDITCLAVDAIVNAANSGMTGCYHPNHNCIDNCIHTYSGIQLRRFCDELMREQGYEEPTGQAKLTPAYNLPCNYVLHTVGPIVQGRLTKEHERLLASCYRSCLDLAERNGVTSIAFCCISTGVFMFPNRRAAEIAVETVKAYRNETGSTIEVVFNVFKETDYEIYKELLGR